MADIWTLGKQVTMNASDLVPIEPELSEQAAMLKSRLGQIFDLIITQAKPGQIGAELKESGIDGLKFEVIEPELAQIIEVDEGLGVYRNDPVQIEGELAEFVDYDLLSNKRVVMALTMDTITAVV